MIVVCLEQLLIEAVGLGQCRARKIRFQGSFKSNGALYVVSMDVAILYYSPVLENRVLVPEKGANTGT